MSIIRKPFFCIMILRGTSVFDRRLFVHACLSRAKQKGFIMTRPCHTPLPRNADSMYSITADFNRIPMVLHFAHFGCYIVHDEGSLPEIVQYDPSSCFECFTASKEFNNYFYLCAIIDAIWNLFRGKHGTKIDASTIIEPGPF